MVCFYGVICCQNKSYEPSRKIDVKARKLAQARRKKEALAKREEEASRKRVEAKENSVSQLRKRRPLSKNEDERQGDTGGEPVDSDNDTQSGSEQEELSSSEHAHAD